MADSFEKLKIYEETEKFPREELYGLTSQIRRAALSVSANIAEAHGRYHYGETVHFLLNARGSCEEVRSHLMATRDIPKIPLDSGIFNEMNREYIGLIKGINGFINSIRRKSTS